MFSRKWTKIPTPVSIRQLKERKKGGICTFVELKKITKKFKTRVII